LGHLGLSRETFTLLLLPIQGVATTQLMQATDVVHAKLPVNDIQAVYKHDAEPSTPSSAEVKNRVELYLYSP